jgi:hypothetical protein
LDKSFANLFSHLKRSRPNTGAKPDQQVFCFTLKNTPGGLNDAEPIGSSEPTPTGMHSGHLGSFVIAKQNRQTIGHHHGASHAQLLGTTSVRLQPIRRLTIDL